MKRRRLCMVLHGAGYLALMAGVIYLLREVNQFQEMLRLVCRYLAGG